MDNRAIADGDPRSDWCPRTPETIVLQAPDIQRMTGLSALAARKLTKRFGFRCGARNWYITLKRLMDALEEIQREGEEL